MSWKNQAFVCAEMRNQNIPVRPPHKLVNFLNAVKFNNAHEALLSMLHVLVLEGSFTPCAEYHTWNKKNFYTIPYQHPTTGIVLCHIKYLPLGSSAIVFATIETKEVAKLHLDTNNFITDYNEQAKPYKVYKNVPELSRKFKDSLLFPMLASLQDFAEVNPTYSLSILPAELKENIIHRLNLRGLVALSATSQEFHQLTNDPEIWRRLLVHDYPQYRYDREEHNWKELYKTEHVAKLKLEKMERERRQRELALRRLEQERMRDLEWYQQPRASRGHPEDFILGFFGPREPPRRRDLASVNLRMF